MEQMRIQVKNELISNVFGNFDENIKKIESAFNVSVINRGDDIVISGNKNGIRRANSVISMLAHIADRGEAITEQNVNYIIAETMSDNEEEVEKISEDTLCMAVTGKPVKPKTLGQKKYTDSIKDNTVIFGIGPAGTGKTYLAMTMAIAAFKNNEVNRIILTRPAIEAGENLGFLPGDMQQKVDPYLRPLYDALFEIMGAVSFLKNLEKGAIEVAPLA
ncbi:MAG: PhoH family protein, partial [Firmicutes bacterium]|nr:PhoH family protein [Bacillota bacterium]